jgi:hypothetical protein
LKKLNPRKKRRNLKIKKKMTRRVKTRRTRPRMKPKLKTKRTRLRMKLKLKTRKKVMPKMLKPRLRKRKSPRLSPKRNTRPQRFPTLTLSLSRRNNTPFVYLTKSRSKKPNTALECLRSVMTIRKETNPPKTLSRL